MRLRHEVILSELANYVSRAGVPADAWPIGAEVESGHVAAALLQARACLLGTHPGIDLRVRVAGDDHPILKIRSDQAYMQGRLSLSLEAAAHGWVDLLGGPVLTPAGTPWIFFEFRPVDIVRGQL